MSKNQSLLKVRNLSVWFEVFEGYSEVLDEVSFHVKREETVGLAGETGCGKSVTMKAVMNILPSPPAIIHSGQILFRGRNILEMSEKELRELKGNFISMIFQDPLTALNPVFTVGDQLKDIIQSARRRSKEGSGLLTRLFNEGQIEKEAKDILRTVRLSDPERIMNSYPFQLSGGMQQRVLIAMALVNQPELLIADEPGTALDVTIQDQILGLLKDLVNQEDVSVLFITHNLGVIREIADSTYVMYSGQISETAPTPKIFTAPQHPYTKGLLNSVPKLTGEGISEGIPGTVPDYVNPVSGCRFRPRCPRSMEICEEKPPEVQLTESHLVKCWLYKDEHESE